MGIFERYAIPIILFIIWIAFSVLNPVIQLKPWFQWFNDLDPQKKYRCFSVMDIANFKYNNLMYKITNLFKSDEVKFKYDFWVYFIWGIMTAQGLHIISNKGLCTPKTLCSSLIPSDYTSVNLPGGFGRNWPVGKDDWKKLIGLWASVPDVTKLTQDTYDDVTKGGVNVKDWYDQTKFPNNFLARWGISPMSPAIIGFITNWSDFRNDKIYPNTLDPLLGIKGLGTPAGGWFGFLQAGDDFGGNGLLEANRTIWSDEPPPMASDMINGQAGGKSCNAASIASGAIGMGMGGAFAGSAMTSAGTEGGAAAAATALEIAGEGGAAETGGASLALTLIGGFIGLLAGGALTAKSQKCI